MCWSVELVSDLSLETVVQMNVVESGAAYTRLDWKPAPTQPFLDKTPQVSKSWQGYLI